MNKKIEKLMVLGLVILISACQEKDLNLNQQQSATTIVTSEIKATEVIRLHEVQGVLLAKNRANLSFQLSGTINGVMVEIGQQVKKGQPLMSLYNPNLDPDLSANLARKESVKAQINQVKRDVADLKSLRESNSASQTALERKQTEYKDLVAQEKSIQAQIEQAQANQSESIIVAPFDGTIAKQNKQIGEYVQPGEIALVVFQQNVLETEVNLTHELWQNLSLNDHVTGLHGDAPLDFIVTELAQTADAQSHLMKVIVDLKTPMKNGIGQSITLFVPQIYQEVYQLPLETVVDDGINQPYIFLSIDDKAFKNPIAPLFIDGQNLIFKSKAQIKSPVVIKGQSRIAAGTRLKELL